MDKDEGVFLVGKIGQGTKILIGAVGFVLLLVLFPDQAMMGAKEGIDLWIKAVFPSLFPFIVAMNILVALDFFKIIGKPLKPIMKALFNLPGPAAFVWIAGLTSGYPVGAKMTVDLMNRKTLTPKQGEYLFMFTNNSGPLFLIGTVGVGMLGSKTAGYLLVTIHFLSSLILGLYYRRRLKVEYCEGKKENALEDSRSKTTDLGKLLGESVINGMELMLLIGGFVIIFSVLIHLLKALDVGRILVMPFMILGHLKVAEAESVEAVLYGIVEVTNGMALVVKPSIDQGLKICLLSFLMGWSGFSIHAQTASVIKGTGFSMKAYLKAKFLQGIISSVMAYMFLKILVLMDKKEVIETWFNKGIVIPQGFHIDMPKLTMVFLVASLLIIVRYRYTTIKGR